MKNILTSIAGIIFGILSTIVIAGIGALIILTTAGIVALLIAIILLIGGILIGYKIFKTIQKKRASDFMSATNASPDLDDPDFSKSTRNNRPLDF